MELKPRLLLSLMLLVPAGFAQYPGQYPGGPPGTYPPGSYPPGGYPGGQGTGIPIPHRSKGKNSSKDVSNEPSEVIRGRVTGVDAKSMVIDADDERTVTVALTDTTKKPDHLAVGDIVEVDAVQDDKGAFTATSINRTKAARASAANGEPHAGTSRAGSSAASAASSAADQIDAGPTTTMATKVELDPDEGAPPTLKHGKPKPSSRPAAEPPEPPPASQTTPTTMASLNAPASAPSVPNALPTRTAPANESRMSFIEKAREAAGTFLDTLPNYVCQQMTTRYTLAGHDWQPIDLVSADLVYDNHQESYKNLQINGKPVKKSIEETGAWSTGEFGTVLDDLFSPATAANFHFVGERIIAHQPSVLYDFEVDHPHSHWNVKVPGQSVRPAYKGTVWIEKDNARVLRIEMQAVKIPESFPFDKTEMALDYDYTNLGGVEKYLLPAKAEILMCERGSSECERNTIEFRNYHKFEGESNIIFH